MHRDVRWLYYVLPFSSSLAAVVRRFVVIDMIGPLKSDDDRTLHNIVVCKGGATTARDSNRRPYGLQ